MAATSIAPVSCSRSPLLIQSMATQKPPSSASRTVGSKKVGLHSLPRFLLSFPNFTSSPKFIRISIDLLRVKCQLISADTEFGDFCLEEESNGREFLM